MKLLHFDGGSKKTRTRVHNSASNHSNFLTSGKTLKSTFKILFFPPGKQKKNTLLKTLNHRIIEWPGVKGILKI